MAVPTEELEPLWIEGYADRTSVAAGEEVGLHVSTSAPAFAIEVARLGAEREVVLRVGDLDGEERTIPPDAAERGCRWPVSATVAVRPEWRSGYYEVVFSCRASGGRYSRRCSRVATSTAFFVVRDAAPADAPGRPRILLQLATNTYAAYTNWAGRSLYAYHAFDGRQGRRVSFDRPTDSQFGLWEEAFVRWAERAGYAIDFAANLDLERGAEFLAPYRLVLSVGHDEYWSSAMRDALEAFVAGGGNAAFFSGNTCCWQVRPDAGGRELICYKQAVAADPLHGQGHDALLSTLWSHHLVGRPENALTGVGFLRGGYHRSHEQFMDGSGAFAVHRPEHWLFEGTGLARGDEFGGKDTIVGYECDGCELEWRDGLPFATGRDGTPASFVPVATAPAKWHPDDCEWYERWEQGRVGAATMGAYERGGTVVTVGTTDWAHGLRGGDPIVERVTRNVLDRLGGR